MSAAKELENESCLYYRIKTFYRESKVDFLDTWHNFTIVFCLQGSYTPLFVSRIFSVVLVAEDHKCLGIIFDGQLRWLLHVKA